MLRHAASMNDFQYRAGVLCAEGVPLSRIAKAVGTPTYVYSTAALQRHFQLFTQSLRGVPHLLCYSVKASSNVWLLRLLAGLGSGFDIVSGGELSRSLRAGADPAKIVECARAMRAKPRDWSNPFGDGKSGLRIVDLLLARGAAARP